MKVHSSGQKGITNQASHTLQEDDLGKVITSSSFAKSKVFLQNITNWIWHDLTEITQPCVHMCNGLFICQLYLLPELLEEMDSNEDTPLTLPFASFVPLSQLIIVI
jgi:hypothetical protein